MFASVRGRAERSRTRTVESAAIRVEASRDNTDRLALMLRGSDIAAIRANETGENLPINGEDSTPAHMRILSSAE